MVVVCCYLWTWHFSTHHVSQLVIQLISTTIHFHESFHSFESSKRMHCPLSHCMFVLLNHATKSFRHQDIYSHLVDCTRVPWESLTSMMISLALVNSSHHWPVIKWFLPCSTLDHCNHMDRIVPCGRWDEGPRYLFKALIGFPQLLMEFYISSMDPHLYGHGYAQIFVCMT